MMGGTGMNTLRDEYVNDIRRSTSAAHEHGTLMLRADPDLVNLAQSRRSATRPIWSRRSNPLVRMDSREACKRLILLAAPAGFVSATGCLS